MAAQQRGDRKRRGDGGDAAMALRSGARARGGVYVEVRCSWLGLLGAGGRGRGRGRGSSAGRREALQDFSVMIVGSYRAAWPAFGESDLER